MKIMTTTVFMLFICTFLVGQPRTLPRTIGPFDFDAAISDFPHAVDIHKINDCFKDAEGIVCYKGKWSLSSEFGKDYREVYYSSYKGEAYTMNVVFSRILKNTDEMTEFVLVATQKYGQISQLDDKEESMYVTWTDDFVLITLGITYIESFGGFLASIVIINLNVEKKIKRDGLERMTDSLRGVI